MSAAATTKIPRLRTPLGLYSPPADESNIARWRINGYRATIVIWTAAEWNGLTERPTDAQSYPGGIWCALRID
jgi:hypothetical protein